MESITKKILAGLLAAVMAMSFAACSENSDDDDDKSSKKVSSSVSETEDTESEEEEEEETTTTTTTEAETEAPEETTTTTEAVEVPTGENVYDDPDFAAEFDPAVWEYFDMSDVDTAALAQENLGINVGVGAQVSCYYYNVNDTATSANIVSTAVPGVTADMDTTEFLDYFTQMFESVSDKMKVLDSKSTKVGNNNAIYVKINVDMGTDTPFVEEQYDIFGDGKMVAVTFTSTESDYDSHASEFKAVLDSLVIK